MRQVGRAGRFIVVAATIFLLPVYVFDHGLIAPEGRPVTAPSLSRLLILGFELVVWGTCVRLLRGNSALLDLAHDSVLDCDGSIRILRSHRRPRHRRDLRGARRTDVPAASLGSRLHGSLVWLGRHRRVVAWLVLAAIAGVIVLDVRGYSFTAPTAGRRWVPEPLVILLAAAAHRLRWAGHRPSHVAVGAAAPFLGFGTDLEGRAAGVASARGDDRHIEPPSSTPADPADVAVEPEESRHGPATTRAHSS